LKLSKTQRQSRLLNFAWMLIVAICAATSVGVRAQSATDASLNAVRASDRIDRAKNGKFQPEITAAENMGHATVYTTNRQFADARAHWQAVLDSYPSDPSVPAAIYGMARSYYQERRYADARQMSERA